MTGSIDIPFIVDLHVWDEIPERFRHNIEKEHEETAFYESLRSGTEGGT